MTFIKIIPKKTIQIKFAHQKYNTSYDHFDIGIYLCYVIAGIFFVKLFSLHYSNFDLSAVISEAFKRKKYWSHLDCNELQVFLSKRTPIFDYLQKKNDLIFLKIIYGPNLINWS